VLDLGHELRPRTIMANCQGATADSVDGWVIGTGIKISF